MKAKKVIIPQDLGNKLMDMPLKSTLAFLAARMNANNLEAGELKINAIGFNFDIVVTRNEMSNQQSSN